MSFKKIILFATLLNGVTVFGQMSEVDKAWDYLQNKYFPMAQQSIEKAVLHPETKELSRTWFMRGLIYETIMAEMGNKITDNQRYETTLAISRSYTKALSYDTSNVDTKVLLRRHNGARGIARKEGLAMNQRGQHAKAKELFIQCMSAAEVINEVDTLAIFNAGVACEKLNEFEEALGYFWRCAKSGFGKAGTYANIAAIYEKVKDFDNMESAILEGRSKYPKDVNLIIGEMNIHIQKTNFDKARILLDSSIAVNQTEPILYFSRASLCDQNKVGDSLQIIADYQKAIELNAYYFEPHYNLGAHYYNKAIAYNNASAAAKKKKVNRQLADTAMTHFNTALHYLELAYKIRPKDKNTQVGLKALYQMLGKNEDYERMMKLHPESNGQ